jgi:hypothetical protein
MTAPAAAPKRPAFGAQGGAFGVQPIDQTLLQDSPQSLERKRRLAEAMLKEGSSYSPIQSWTQGMARVANSVMGGLESGWADKREADGRAQSWKEIMGGGQAPGASPGGDGAGATDDGRQSHLIPADKDTSWQTTIASPQDAADAGGHPHSPGFVRSMAQVFGFEGGRLAADTNGTPSLYGMNKAAHPEFDTEHGTRAQAAAIYKRDYWDKINADSLPPELQTIAFDTAVMSGPGRAQQFIKESGGDPYKFMQLRTAFLGGLLKSNPEKYGRFANAWHDRNATLMAGLQQPGDQPAVADAGRCRAAGGCCPAERHAGRHARGVEDRPGRHPGRPHAAGRAQQHGVDDHPWRWPDPDRPRQRRHASRSGCPDRLQPVAVGRLRRAGPWHAHHPWHDAGPDRRRPGWRRFRHTGHRWRTRAQRAAAGPGRGRRRQWRYNARRRGTGGLDARSGDGGTRDRPTGSWGRWIARSQRSWRRWPRARPGADAGPCRRPEPRGRAGRPGPGWPAAGPRPAADAGRLQARPDHDGPRQERPARRRDHARHHQPVRLPRGDQVRCGSAQLDGSAAEPRVQNEALVRDRRRQEGGARGAEARRRHPRPAGPGGPGERTDRPVQGDHPEDPGRHQDGALRARPHRCADEPGEGRHQRGDRAHQGLRRPARPH